MARASRHGVAVWCVLVGVCGAGVCGASAPVVFWASDPIRPGEAVLAVGDAFGSTAVVEVVRLADGPPGAPTGKPFGWPGGASRVAPLQPGGRSVKFVVPAALRPGVFAYRISAGRGAAVGLLNRPVIYWVQGDVGVTARPGGWVRALGKNLGWPNQKKGPPTTVLLRGPKTVCLNAEAGRYSAKAGLPGDLPVGGYEVFVHNGRGGPSAWSQPVVITIEAPRPWPKTVLDVRDFGADASGRADSSAPIRAALAHAGTHGGGVVYFPRGRYRVTGELSVPPRTVLRGERQPWVSLYWPDHDDPPPALIRGTHSFGVENLTVYATRHVHVIAADQRTPDAGHVFVRRVRIRVNRFRGHLKPAEVHDRFMSARRQMGGDCLRLGGQSVEVTDCDIYGSGRALFLSGVRGGRVTGNTFYNGRWGWYCISGSDGLVFEHNRIIGGDLMATGGGLNCLDGSTCSQNVYYAHNRLSLMHGWDREAMTSDAGGGGYCGGVVSVDGTRTTLAADPKTGPHNWVGAALFVLDGRARGQYRRVGSVAGRVVTLNRPWTVPPDRTSVVTLTMLQRRYLFVGNDFADAGVALQLYGMAIEHIADGNVSTRTAGFHNFGMNYHGIQPSWFIQWLGNEIREGNVYRGDHDNWRLSGDAHIGVYGLIGTSWKRPITLGAIVRRNRLLDNASIVLGSEWRGGVVGRTDPLVTDVVVENNHIEHSDVGVRVFQTTRGVLLRDNRFRNVKQHVWDEAEVRKAIDRKRRTLLGGANPIAAWNFDEAATGTVLRVRDATGHGFDATAQGVRLVAGGVRGRGAAFAGSSFLRVDNPLLHNLPTVTLSAWIKPTRVTGRCGLVGKRFRGTVAPYILSLRDGTVDFQAAEPSGTWSFNFHSPPVVKPGRWHHVAAVVEQGKGVTLFCNGRAVAHKANPRARAFNREPLVIGREAWDGTPNVHRPCYFQGMMDEVRIWARALTPEEIRREYNRVSPKR